MKESVLLAMVSLVGDLNDKLYSHLENLPGHIFRPFVISSDGDQIWVEFMNFQLWNSSDDPDLSLDEAKRLIVEEAQDILVNFKKMKVVEP